MPVLRRMRLRRRMTAALEQWHLRATWAALKASMQYRRNTLEIDGGGKRRPGSSFSRRANAAEATVNGLVAGWISGLLGGEGGGRKFIFIAAIVTGAVGQMLSN